MTAPSEIDAALAMSPKYEISPHISNALDRIKSGWRVGYFYGYGWFVYNLYLRCGGPYMKRDEVLATYKRVTAEARAEYLRLSAREE
jgi:hypothetical protein